jgi:tetratricopeptide (TPR) repeat protein
MKQEGIEKYFADLTADQIAQERPGKWSDSDLVDVWNYFMEQVDRERETAVLELILRSPDHSQDMVDYSELYHELAQNYRLEKQYPQAIGWLYAAIAYNEQHEPSTSSRIFWRSNLAETYLYANELNTALIILTHNLQLQPSNLDSYSIPAYALLELRYHDLVAEMANRALLIATEIEDERFNDQWQDLLAEIEEADEMEKSHLSEVDTAVLDNFRAALALPIPADADEDVPHPFLPPIDQLTTAASLTPTLTSEILAQSKVLIPELIRLAFSDPSTPGPAHAIALLRQLRDMETAVFTQLSPWLDKADGNWQETLSDSMGKIGGITTAELKAIAADTTYDTFVRTNATNAL